MEASFPSPAALAPRVDPEPRLPDAPAREAAPFERREPDLDLMRARPTPRRSHGNRVVRAVLVLAMLAALGVLGWVAYEDLTGTGSTTDDAPVVTFPIIDDLSTP